MIIHVSRAVAVLAVVLAQFLPAAGAQAPALKKGDRIVFLGDSITAGGVRPDGYITLIRQALAANAADLAVETIGAGVSGNKVPDLQKRLEKDVLDKKPTIVFIYIGINDVWHWKKQPDGSLAGGTPKDKYEEGLRNIIARVRAAGARAILCTPSVIGEKHDGSNERDAMLDEYAAISRRVAAAAGAELLDLRKAFLEYEKANNPENKDRGILTTDGVHLNAAGNRLVAAEMLRVLGVPAAPPAPPPLLIKAKAKPDSPWKEYPTRTLDHLPAFKPDAALPPLTVYGGRADRKARATGFFRVEKVGNRWWLVDPDGGLFIHAGVCAVRPGTSRNNQAALKEKFGSPERWAAGAAELLRSAGFNGAGAWSDAALLRTASRPVAYTLIWNFMSSFAKKKGLATQQPGHTGYPNDCILVFHPEFPAFCRELARALEATKNDPWLVGHFSDNEMPAPRDMLDRFLALDAADANFAPGRRAAEAWLAARKGGPASARDATADDREAFMGYVFERYFEITTAAIREHDPNHLCLGSRFYSNEKRSPSVFRGAGKYLDVISVNYYGAWTPDLKTLADWTAWSGRPVMITEWYTKGADTPLKNSTGAGWIVPTQNDRGLFYENYTLALLESACVVGWHWFKYMDNDPEDLSTDPSNRDSNKGIVAIRYEPYDALLAHMRRLNRNIYALADYFDSVRGSP